MKKKITVISPVYNEENLINEFYLVLKKNLILINKKYTGKILFVVDRCTDDTLSVLKRIALTDHSVSILYLSSRFGHQLSLLAGIDFAKDADIIIMMDSDLQHPPELIPTLISKYEEGNDVVTTVRKKNTNQTILRKILGRLYYKALAWLTNIKIVENGADFRLISKRVANIIRLKTRERNLFLRGLFSWVGFNQASVEFTANERLNGRSKYSVTKLLKFAVSGIISFSTKPLQLISLTGIFFSFISFIMVLFIIFSYYHSDYTPQGWSSLIILMIFFNGITFVFLGILGAYIAGIYGEVKNRPHYLVDEKINITTEEDFEEN